ncbi:MAG: hypothetical protein ACYCVD_07070 [Desulfitobacteriaceae bacterium]
MRRKGWGEFLLYLVRVFLLLVLLAFLLPKLVAVWGVWISSLEHGERKPNGNPMRVENRPWSEFVIQLFPDKP